jgi:hypothetical protein
VIREGDDAVGAVYTIEELTSEDIAHPDDAFIAFAQANGFRFINRYTAAEFSRSLLSQLGGVTGPR